MSNKRRYPAYPAKLDTEVVSPAPQNTQTNQNIQNTGCTMIPVVENTDFEQAGIETFSDKTLQNQIQPDQIPQIQPLLESQQQKQVVESNILQLTHSALPITNTELLKNRLPVGMTIQPMLSEKLPDVDFNAELHINPPRCQNCKAFVNCYSQFSSTGRLLCNLCGFESQLDFEYERIARDPQLQAQRAELNCEAYSIRAPDIYRVRRTDSFETYTFLVDISPQALESGLVAQVQSMLAKKLEELSVGETRTMVSIILFNTQTHFLVFHSRANYSIFTVPDSENSYIPAPRDIIVSVQSRGAPVLAAVRNLEAIARSIPALPIAGENCKYHSGKDVCFYNAVESAYKCMQAVGGKIVYFLSSMPSCGLGAVHKNEEKRRDLGKKTEGDIKVALTCDQGVYSDLGMKCSSVQISIDGIVATGLEYVDIASLMEMSRVSCGNLRYLFEYDPVRDAELCEYYLGLSVNSTDCMEACIRMRASRQIDFKYFYGKGHNGNQNLMNLAHIDSEQTIGTEFNLTDALRLGQYVYFQLSFLYTDKSNVRLIRSVTKRVRVESNLQFIQSVNVQNQIGLYIKKISTVLRQNSDVQNQTVSYCSDTSGAVYSVSMSSNSTFNQIFQSIHGHVFSMLKYYLAMSSQTVDSMPSQFHQLLLYCFALLKTPMMKPMGARVTMDERASFMSLVEGATNQKCVQLIYPMCYDLSGQRCRLSADGLQANGVYVIQAPYCIYVYFGLQCDLGVISQVTGEAQPNLAGFMPLSGSGEYYERVCENVQQIWAVQGVKQQVYCISAQSRMTAPVLSCLIESRIDGASFEDFKRMLNINLTKKE